jgi:phosphate:Na+ symporter
MAYNGWITFPAAVGIVLGENIGTTITAYLASLGMNTNAKRTARAHMLFNIIGVAWVLTLFYPFLSFVDWVVPGEVSDSTALPIHLSAFHTIFNVTNTFVLVWFVPQIAKIVTKLVKEKESKDDSIKLSFVSSKLPDSTETNLVTSRKAIAQMSDKVYDLMLIVLNSPENPIKAQMEASAIEDYTDIVQHRITEFLTQCTRNELSESEAGIISSQQRITNELERIGDACYRITLLFRRMDNKKLKFHKSGMRQIQNYMSLVLDYLKYNSDYLNYRISKYDLEMAFEMENNIDKERVTLRRNAQDMLYAGADVRGELVFMDIVKYVEHIGDHSLNIAQAIKNIDDASQ